MADEPDSPHRPRTPCSNARSLDLDIGQDHADPSLIAHHSSPETTYVEIFSSYLVSDCEQRAFVLKAVGVEHLIARSVNRYVLLVPESQAERALEHLRIYEEESKPAPPERPLQLHGRAWTGSLVFALVMLGIAYCAGDDVGGFNWYDAGALRGGLFRSGEWWRVVTALTLHADVAHLIGNLTFGIPYGYFASQLLGAGRAWASILLAAALGNLLDSALMSDQQSIGASTAVFAMLGIVGAYAWREGQGRFNRWAHRWAPLVAAVALLALTGVGGERTDIVAHLAGFLFGAAVGTAQAHLPASLRMGPVAQILAGALTGAVVAASWALALAG